MTSEFTEDEIWAFITDARVLAMTAVEAAASVDRLGVAFEQMACNILVGMPTEEREAALERYARDENLFE